MLSSRHAHAVRAGAGARILGGSRVRTSVRPGARPGAHRAAGARAGAQAQRRLAAQHVRRGPRGRVGGRRPHRKRLHARRAAALLQQHGGRLRVRSESDVDRRRQQIPGAGARPRIAHAAGSQQRVELRRLCLDYQSQACAAASSALFPFAPTPRRTLCTPPQQQGRTPRATHARHRDQAPGAARASACVYTINGARLRRELRPGSATSRRAKSRSARSSLTVASAPPSGLNARPRSAPWCPCARRARQRSGQGRLCGRTPRAVRGRVSAAHACTLCGPAHVQALLRAAHSSRHPCKGPPVRWQDCG